MAPFWRNSFDAIIEAKAALGLGHLGLCPHHAVTKTAWRANLGQTVQYSGENQDGILA